MHYVFSSGTYLVVAQGCVVSNRIKMKFDMIVLQGNTH